MMTEVEIDDEILSKIDEIGKRLETSRDDIISGALRDFINENLETTWKEKGSLKKKKGPQWKGAIPVREYKSE